MSARDDGGPAFPLPGDSSCNGMTLHDFFAGEALSNPSICHGEMAELEVTAEFGKDAGGITRAQVVARQAFNYANAMLKERSKP